MERWAGQLARLCRKTSLSSLVAPLVILLSVSLLGGFVVNVPVAQAAVGDLVIFADSFEAGFSHNQYNGTNNLVNAAPVKVGAYSIATKPDAYQGILINIPDGVKFASSGSLRLWVHGGAGGETQFGVGAYKDSVSVSVGVRQVLPDVPANTWVQVSVPLTSLLGSLAAFDAAVNRSLWFTQGDGLAHPMIYLDQIELVAGAAPATTTTSTTAVPTATAAVTSTVVGSVTTTSVVLGSSTTLPVSSGDVVLFGDGLVLVFRIILITGRMMLRMFRR